MALTRIEYGSLASSETINENNKYLEDKIAEVSETLTATTATVNSNIATVNSNISKISNSIAESESELKDEISTLFSSNGLYITTYINGKSWYREFFSDSTKTTRVWIEQGGTCTTNATTRLLKPMSNTDYTLTLGRRGAYNEAESQNTDRTTESFYIKNNKGYKYDCDFYVCGQ